MNAHSSTLDQYGLDNQRICLRQNLIPKITGLDACPLIEELDLYDNQISVIENLDSLVKLT